MPLFLVCRFPGSSMSRHLRKVITLDDARRQQNQCDPPTPTVLHSPICLFLILRACIYLLAHEYALLIAPLVLLSSF